MLSLFLRNLFFTILQPGIVAGLFPWLIVKEKSEFHMEKTWTFSDYVAAIIFAAGFLIMMKCIIDFAIKGRGTLSPADPTKKLVISGLYRFSRNPMYVGVLLILIGETIFFRSVGLAVYTVFILIAFTLFVKFREEPRLRKDFGADYEQYCGRVRRWI